MRRLLVIGAAGDVGRGIVQAAGERGWKVAAAGRSLARLQEAVGGSGELVEGSIASEAEAARLWEAASAALGGIDAVAVSVNAPNVSRPLLEWTPAELAGVLEGNLLTHFIAARTFLARLAPGGVFVGVGGGTADFVMPKAGHLSVAQAGLRMMYRALAKEAGEVALREMLIAAMVNGASKRAVADPNWITDIEVGRHLCAIVAAPHDFPGPIVTLRSREQVGQPEAAPAPRPAKG